MSRLWNSFWCLKLPFNFKSEFLCPADHLKNKWHYNSYFRNLIVQNTFHLERVYNCSVYAGGHVKEGYLFWRPILKNNQFKCTLFLFFVIVWVILFSTGFWEGEPLGLCHRLPSWQVSQTLCMQKPTSTSISTTLCWMCSWSTRPVTRCRTAPWSWPRWVRRAGLLQTKQLWDFGNWALPCCKEFLKRFQSDAS